MKRLFLFSLLLSMVILPTGCSSKLSRRQAEKQINEMLKPHEVGPKKLKVAGGVPGFSLPSDESPGLMMGIFHFEQHKGFDNSSSDMSERNLAYALASLGYVQAKDDGPTTEIFNGTKLSYPHSLTVVPGPKLGPVTSTDYSRHFASGFQCYPAPRFDQCQPPPFIEVGKDDFKITGIVQDETHAKVNVLIPWKLTPLAVALKPFAADVEKHADTDSDYYRYAALFAWEHFLNAHAATGSSPAVILFQKFDDGWRIVDENGKSEKDFAS